MMIVAIISVNNSHYAGNRVDQFGTSLKALVSTRTKNGSIRLKSQIVFIFSFATPQ
jgi:hypothetical protein